MRGLAALAALAAALGAAAPAADAQSPTELVCGPLQQVGAGLDPLPAVQPAAQDAADLGCALDALHFATVYDPLSGEPIRRRHSALLNTPTPIDVDENPGPDLTAQLDVVDANHARMYVTRFAGAAERLPVSVEAVMRDPRPGELRSAAFGYDGRMATAPDVFDATLSLEGLGRGTTATVAMQIGGARGDALAVTGELFTPGPDDRRLDPQRARATYSPVPDAATITASMSDASSKVTLAASAPARVDIDALEARGTEERTVEATLDRLPGSITLELSRPSEGESRVDYDASAPVDRVDVDLTERSAGALTRRTTVALEDVPTVIDLVQSGSERVVLDANGPIGVLDAAMASGGEALRLDEPAYVRVHDRAGLESVAVRVLGLTHAEVVNGDPLVVDTALRAGPFRALIEQGTRTIDARIADLPAIAHLEVSPAAGTVRYSGAARVGELTIDADDPAGLLGRATRLDLLMRDLPTTLALGFAQQGDAVTLDAGGQEVGLVEVQATSGPNATLDPAYDGVVLQDVASHYLMFGRVTGLRKVSLLQGASSDLFLDATGNRVFKIDVNQLEGSKTTYTRATLDRLQRNTRIRLVPTAAGQQITYSAAARTNSLNFDTNAGDRQKLHADVSGPLPASLTICQASDRSCGGSGRTANSGSVALTASEHTTVNLFDCQRPLSSTCSRSNSTESIDVDNLRVRKVVEDANLNSTGSSGHIYLDTDNHALSGDIEIRQSGAVDRIRANFPAGFRAENRLRRWSFYVVVESRGSVSCPSGTNLDIRILGVTVGVTGYLCGF